MKIGSNYLSGTSKIYLFMTFFLPGYGWIRIFLLNESLLSKEGTIRIAKFF